MRYLSRKEEMVLLIIWRLGDNAYGVPIRDEIMKLSKKYWSVGAIHDVLDRLARQELVSKKKGDSMKERGGRRKVLYNITGKGYKALKELNQAHETFWSGLPGIKLNERDI